MTLVETVRGPVDTADLGVTLAHEHVFVVTVDSQQQWPGEWDEQQRVAEAVDKLTSLVRLGVRTIVDPTVDGLGRNIARIQRVNAQVPDLNIIVATGIYTYADVPGFFSGRGPGALPDLPEVMDDLFVRDVTVGIQGTSVKAAFLKCAIDHYGLTRGVERVMRAVARAHRRTGAPVMVHTHPGSRTGDEVARVLGEEGVHPSRVLLAHSGDTTDADHLAELAETGFLLGMDRFGLDISLPFEQRVEVVAQMCRRGYAGQMVLAHDAACYIDWVDPALMPFLPNWHYEHVHRDVLPALRAAGVTDADIALMLIDTPRRWFDRAGAY